MRFSPRIHHLKFLLNTLALGLDKPRLEQLGHPWANALERYQQGLTQYHAKLCWQDVHVMGTLFSSLQAPQSDFGAPWHPGLARLQESLEQDQGLATLASWEEEEEAQLPELEEQELALPDEPLPVLAVTPVREQSADTTPPAPQQATDKRFQGMWGKVSNHFFNTVPWQGGAQTPIELRMEGEMQTPPPLAQNPVAAATYSAMQSAQRLAARQTNAVSPPKPPATCGTFFRDLPWQGRRLIRAHKE